MDNLEELAGEARAAIEAARNEIAVLAGKVPGTLGIDLDKGARQPRVSLSPEVGIPADLLRNRPIPQRALVIAAGVLANLLLALVM